MDTEIFGIAPDELMASEDDEASEPASPTIGEMPQEEFAEQMAGLINYVMDCRQMEPPVDSSPPVENPWGIY
jgi:hypothetical protein